MLSKGNSKLGRGIWSWSLPVVKTCPGASTTCLALCYATRGFYHFPSIGEAHWRNLEATEEKDFVDNVVQAIEKNRIKVFRIHCAGDFYSAAYVRKWLRIVDQRPNTIFYAYTRSWRVTRLQKSLRALAKRPNVRLWLSTDRSMSKPPVWAACRTCYLSTQDSDVPGYRVDLIFRDKPKTIVKHTDSGALICPFENGINYERKLTCETCGVCWDRNKMSKALPPRSGTNPSQASLVTLQVPTDQLVTLELASALP